MHAVVDTYSNYAFAILHTSGYSNAAMTLLEERVLPFYIERGLRVGAIATEYNDHFIGTDGFNPYGEYLASHGVYHMIERSEEQANNLMKPFKWVARDEFVREALQRKSYDVLEDLQRDFDEWLCYFNTERSHPGYPNTGKKPIEKVDEYVNHVRMEGCCISFVRVFEGYCPVATLDRRPARRSARARRRRRPSTPSASGCVARASPRRPSCPSRGSPGRPSG